MRRTKRGGVSGIRVLRIEAYGRTERLSKSSTEEIFSRLYHFTISDEPAHDVGDFVQCGRPLSAVHRTQQSGNVGVCVTEELDRRRDRRKRPLNGCDLDRDLDETGLLEQCPQKAHITQVE